MRTVGGAAEGTLLGSLRKRMALVVSELGLCVRHDLNVGILTLTTSQLRRSIEVTPAEVRAKAGASDRAAFKSAA